MDKNTRLFLEGICISIRKFLDDHYDVCGSGIPKDNKRWRIKHQEINFLPNIVPVSLGFCERYVDLVYQGKIIIVKDEFGKYRGYVNPRLIKEVPEEQDLILYLEEMGINDNVVDRELEQIAETKRIVNAFHGENEILRNNKLCDVVRRRKKNEEY